MDRFSYKTLFLIVVLLLIPIVFLLRLRQKPIATLAAWFNDSWHYRMAVNVGTSGGSALTNYQVSVSVGTSALIAAGKMKSDCADIRVTDLNGNLLPYWLSGCNTDATQIWPKVPSIPTSGATIFIYYGNPSASAGKTKVGTSDYPGLSCKSILDAGDSTGNGTYWIDPTNGDPADKFQAYCDMVNDSGGWMLVTQSMINSEVGQTMNAVKTDGANGGLVYTMNSLAPFDCTTRYSRLYFNDIIPWTKIKADYTFTGGNSCWGIFGNTAFGASSNLIAYVGGTDTIRNEVKMGGSNGDTFDGTTTRCDNTTTNFWHNNQGVGITRSAQVILRRNSMAAVAGLSTGIACTTGAQPWKYSNIYIRETAMNIFPTSASLAPEETGGGPVAWWKFDEGVGTTAFDSSVNHNDGSFGTGNAAPAWAADDQCVSGKCLFFNGSASVVTVRNSPSLQITGSQTLSLWVKPNQLGARRNPIAKAYGGEGTITFEPANNLNYYWGTGGGNTTPYEAKNSAIGLTLNQWNHIVVVRDLTNNFIAWYLNGKRTSSSAPGYAAAVASALNLTIGNGYAGAFSGYIDDVKIFNYARTADQVNQEYAAGSSGQSTAHGANTAFGSSSQQFLSNGLVGYWKFDEGVGTTSADFSGSTNVATFGTGDSAPGWSGGKYGIGISFDGANDKVLIANNSPLQFSSENISVGFWIKTSAAKQSLLVGKGNGSGRIYITVEADGGIRMNCYFGPGYDYWSTSSTKKINDGNFHYITVTYDRQGLEKLYIDGVVDKQINISPASALPWDSSSQFILSSGAYSFFDGILDEVRVYNRALSPDDIKQLYGYAPGPVGYWNFEEGTGNAVLDKSGNNLTGGIHGTPQWLPGKKGKSLNFQVVDQGVTVADNDLLKPSTITVEAWVNPSNFVNWGTILMKSNSGWTDGYGLAHYTSGNDIYFYVNSYSTGGRAAVNIPTNTWTHLAGTYDGSTVKIYANGVLASSANYSVGFTNSSQPLLIGYGSGSASYRWVGGIDDVKIYNYARSQSQILEDMGTGAGSKDPIAWYKFDEGASQTAHDSSSNKLNAVLSGGSLPTWSDGKYGKAISIGGTASWVDAGTQPAFNITGPISFGGWVYPKSFNGAYRRMIDKGYGTQYQISFGNVDPTTYAYCGLKIGSTWAAVTSGNSVSTNKWTYLMCTYDGDKIRLYQDGTLKNTSVSYTGPVNVSSNKLAIGSNPNGGENFNGLIDDIKIFNYALSADEIAKDYNRGATSQFGQTNQTIGATTTSLNYCVPGDIAYCANPVAEWTFEEGAGTTAFDTSGNNLHAAWSGTGSRYGNGKFGKAAVLNGNDDHFAVPENAALNPTTDMSLGFWLKKDNLGVATSRVNIAFKLEAGAGAVRRGYALDIEANTNRFTWWFGNDTGYDSGTSTGSIPNTGWNYYTLTRSGTTIKFYINGILDSTQTVAGSSWNATAATPLDFSSNNWSRLRLNGSLDQVRIYNYARTPAQVAYDYNKGGPVGWWKLDDCQGATAFDSSGLGNTGAISIGPSGTQNSLGTCQAGTSAAWTNGATGKINSSLNFDGTDDYVEIADNPSLNLTAGYSLSAWIRPHSFPQYTCILERGTAVDSRYYIWLNYNDVRWGVNNDYINYDTNFNQDEWALVTVVHNNLTDMDYVYKNSTLVGSNPNRTTDPATTGVLRIGRPTNASYQSGYYSDGQIDDVRIYNYPLTSTQIQQLYNGGAASFK